MATFAASIAAYGMALLFVPAMRAPFLRDRFAAIPLAVVAHIVGSAIALAIGPLQLSARRRARSIEIHRWLGRLYVGGILCGGVAALVMARVSQGGLPAHVGFGLLGVLWLGATAMAYARIRWGDRAAHREWMIRSYALTFAAVTLRVYLPLSQAIGLPFEPAYQTISWLCWVPNLIAAEWLVLRRPAARPRQPSKAIAAA
jgi:uncharacterized membrane protein